MFLLVSISIFILVSFSAVSGDYSDTESHVYIDFSTKQSKGWEGISGWKWVSSHKGMTLTGVAEIDGDLQVLTLNTDSAGSLTSPQLDVSPSLTSCLYMNYYIRVPNHKDYGLKVKTVSTSGQMKQIWAMSRQDYDVWETAAMQIDRREKLKVSVHLY